MLVDVVGIVIVGYWLGYVCDLVLVVVIVLVGEVGLVIVV